MVMSTFGIYSSYKLKEKSSKFYPLLIQVPRGKMMTETKPLIASKQRLFYFYFRSFLGNPTGAFCTWVKALSNGLRTELTLKGNILVTKLF